MKAMIFAAGLGTRLKPLTDHKPKALVEVAGVPMLERVIRKVIAAGITDIVVNVHHFAPQVVDFVNANDRFGANISISDESDMLLDTGGGILAAEPLLQGGEPILVHNADILTDMDIAEMEQAHAQSGAMATLLVKRRQTSRYLVMNPALGMRMRGWANVSTGQAKPAGLQCSPAELFAFGGVHIISPAIFPALHAYAERHGEKAFPIMPFYIDTCQHCDIRGYQPSAPYMWHDIGKPESLAAANSAMG